MMRRWDRENTTGFAEGCLLEKRHLIFARAEAILPDNRRRGMFDDGDDPGSHEPS